MKTVRALKSELFDFHREEGFELYESFPLQSTDPTLLFTNATITPFKNRHIGLETPRNYALIQQCLRTGGATELEKIGVSKQCFTFFEMFGSGIFGCGHTEAVSYLIRMLEYLGINRDGLYFVIPPSRDFHQALLGCDFDESRIFFLESNSVYWVDWGFGSGGPIGKGITVVYSQCGNRPISVAEMELLPDNYIELLNLIHISAFERDGAVFPCSIPAFDLGVGIERLAAIVQDCSPYEIDTIAPIVRSVRRNLPEAEESKQRMLADHLRACLMIILDGCRPSNKKGGYVLRMLLRRCFETSSLVLKGWSGDTVLSMFAETIEIQEKTSQHTIPRHEILATVERELSLFKGAVRNSIRALTKNPKMDDDQFRSTYGSSRSTAAVFASIDL